MLFLVGSCPSEVIKLDLSRAAARLSPALRAAGAGAQLFGQRHRDHLHPGRGRLPRLAGAELPAARRTRRPRCWWSARWPTWSRTSSRRLFAQLGIGHGRASCRPARSDAMPAVGPNTRFLLAQPFLADTARALEARGARRIAAPFPLGAEGTTRWLQAAAAAFGIGAERRRAGHRQRRARAPKRRWRASARRCRASASSSSPTRSSRCRWRASCRASWACA